MFWQPLLVGNRLFLTVDRTRRLILFSVVIIIPFIRLGSDREIYVTRTYGNIIIIIIIINYKISSNRPNPRVLRVPKLWQTAFLVSPAQ